MTLPSGYLPRKGDILILHAIVSYGFDPGDNHVGLKVSHSSLSCPLDRIVGIYARAWEEGDDVRNTNDHDDVGKVVATHEDKVWVKTAGGALVTFDANALEAVPDLSAPAPEAPPPAPGPADAAIEQF